jgi:GTP-dependent phosphoenolpyruvate carboxykinase
VDIRHRMFGHLIVFRFHLFTDKEFSRFLATGPPQLAQQLFALAIQFGDWQYAVGDEMNCGRCGTQLLERFGKDAAFMPRVHSVGAIARFMCAEPCMKLDKS